MNTNATKAAHAPVHPLDPLSGAEMQLACDLVKAAEKLDSHARFPMVELREPPKAEVVAFKTGEYFSRTAFVLAIDRYEWRDDRIRRGPERKKNRRRAVSCRSIRRRTASRRS